MKTARSFPSTRAHSSSSCSTMPPSEYESGAKPAVSTSWFSSPAYCGGVSPRPSPLNLTVRSARSSIALPNATRGRLAAIPDASPPIRTNCRRSTRAIVCLLRRWMLRQVESTNRSPYLLPAWPLVDLVIVDLAFLAPRRHRHAYALAGVGAAGGTVPAFFIGVDHVSQFAV